MKTLCSTLALVLIGLCTLAAPLRAQAESFLDGRTLVFAFAYPSSINGAGSSRVVGSGVEYTASDISGPYWRLDVSNTTLEFTFARATTWRAPDTWNKPFSPGANGSALMNGLRMSDNAGSVPDFGSFQVLAGTSLPGFTPDRVRVSANTLLVDFAGLTSAVGDKVVLQLSPVPEPHTAGLLLMGLAAGLVRSRLQRRAALAA